MRDMKLSFRSSIYGCMALIFIFLSRIISYLLQHHPEQLHRFSDPLNFLLTLGAILFLLRATGTAGASIKKLRTGKPLLTAIEIILMFDLFYLIGAQALHFTLGINIHNNLFVVFVSILISLPAVCGLYALYFSKQLRNNLRYPVCFLFWGCVIWLVLRILQKVFLPLVDQYTVLSDKVLEILYSITSINDTLSLILFICAFVLLCIYAYFCAKIIKKMPTHSD